MVYASTTAWTTITQAIDEEEEKKENTTTGIGTCEY
jgi:hypothetical protein